MRKILITGIAGFIGYQLAKYLVDKKFIIYGIDNLNTYYDVNLKINRIKDLGIQNYENKTFESSTIFHNKLFFKKNDLVEFEKLDSLIKEVKPNFVVNLAAQAGVRYSLDNPRDYLNSNLVGFFNLLEACKNNNIKNVIYASSSSVYGLNDKFPFEENDNTDCPISFYAATKKSNEVMSYSYSHLYKLKLIGLRFFTVYGPWGRPDMAYFKFVKKIINNEQIEVYNNGKLHRDFTYIDDITHSIYKLIIKFDSVVEVLGNNSILNIGNSSPILVSDFISSIESILNVKANKKLVGMKMGDVYKTYSDSSKLQNLIQFKPNTDLKEGLIKFIDWYKTYNLI
jgi:UDP-glucuronate 4-epimerase